MRVTKIVKEYVEKVVWKKHDEIVAQIPKVKKLYDTEEFKAKEAEYLEFASKRFDVLLEELAKKRAELGIELVPFKLWSYSRENTTYDELMRDRMCFDTYLNNALKDDEYNEYVQRIADLKTEYQDKIDTILIGLEIGDIKKQELEAALEEFKV